MKNIYRDKTINMMSESDVGTNVRLAGWVENIRDHGGVSFIDLRDMYGQMQIVLRHETPADPRSFHVLHGVQNGILQALIQLYGNE